MKLTGINLFAIKLQYNYEYCTECCKFALHFSISQDRNILSSRVKSHNVPRFFTGGTFSPNFIKPNINISLQSSNLEKGNAPSRPTLEEEEKDIRVLFAFQNV